MRHNSFICDPHVRGCECEPRDEFVCNPYCVLDYCPTDGEGEECEADPNRLIRVPVGDASFTYGLKED